MEIKIYQIQDDGSGILIDQKIVADDSEAIMAIKQLAEDGKTYSVEQIFENSSRIIAQVP